MPPQPGQKGTKKKSGRDARTSRSRNTTPGSVSGGPVSSTGDETALLQMRIKPYQGYTYDDLIDQQINPAIPDSKSLDALIDRLQRLLDAVEERTRVSDRGMRKLAAMRKDRLEEVEVERREEDRKQRMKRDEEEEKSRKEALSNKKKDGAKSKTREERPLTHGAHGVAAQDGTSTASKASSSKHARHDSIDGDSASSSLSPVESQTPAAATGGRADVDSESADEHQPPPAPAVPHLQTFGEDPSTFPDSTIYEIRQLTPDMSEEEIKKIYSVADYPHVDLTDMIPGTPPDKDFSNAKPANQVQANTFQTYLEPYFRPYSEEDVAFLRERGDRVTPFVIPRRGKKHYREQWDDEDGMMSTDGGRERLPANQARGNLEDMDDTMAETEEVSTGPLASRLLSLLRPENRAPETSNGANGDVSGENDDLSNILGLPADEPAQPLPSATFMADSNTEAWRKATHPKLDHAQVDERVKQELRHIGFLGQDTEPDFDGHFDDDIAARLRFLQGKLKEVSIVNGARKARLMDLVQERMAHQEYKTIAEDLDAQVNTQHGKRTRTMGKSKKNKRPGGAGGGSNFNGQAKPGIGDQTKTLLERRKKWTSDIGPVFDSEKGFSVPRVKEDGSSIFKPEDMADYVRRERETWAEEEEEEE